MTLYALNDDMTLVADQKCWFNEVCEYVAKSGEEGTIMSQTSQEMTVTWRCDPPLEAYSAMYSP